MLIISYDRANWKADYFSKVSKEEKKAMNTHDSGLPIELKSAMNRKEKILDKINQMPEDKRKIALREFELHEYYSRNEHKHNTMIRDISHPDMAVDYNDEWIV